VTRRFALVRRTRPLQALLRVLRAPWLVLGLWVVQLVLAWLLSFPVRMVGEAARGTTTWFDDGHRLRAFVELLVEERGVVAAIMASLASSGLIALVLAIVVAPATIRRLARPTELARLGQISATMLAPTLVQTLYGLVPRALFGGLAALVLALAGPPGLPIAGLLVSIPTLALDRARVAIVLEGQRRYHPMTHLRALALVLRRPLWLVCGALLEGLQLLVGIAALVLVISPTGAAMGAGALWLARLAGLAALGLGAWRIAIAVEDAVEDANPD
jgi:hypothetical protein